MAGRSLEGLCAALAKALEEGDAETLGGLYLPTAVLAVGVGSARLESTPQEAAADRARLGLPIATSIQSVEQDGPHASVVLDWSVAGMTADGTELDLAGDITLECTLLGADWYVAAEEMRCHEHSRRRSAPAPVPGH